MKGEYESKDTEGKYGVDCQAAACWGMVVEEIPGI